MNGLCVAKGWSGWEGERAAASGVVAPPLTALVHGLSVQWGGVPAKGVVVIPSVEGGFEVDRERERERVRRPTPRDPLNYNKL